MSGMTTIDRAPLSHRISSASLRRTLEVRIALLEQEQASDIREFDGLYALSDALFFRISERQRQLRAFREILLHRRAA